MSELMDKISERQHESVRAARQADPSLMLPEEDHIEPIVCPACSDHGAKYFGVIAPNTTPDVMVEDGYATVVSSGAIHTLHAGRFLCDVCTSHLDSPEELKAAGVDTSWEIEDHFERNPTSTPHDY